MNNFYKGISVGSALLAGIVNASAGTPFYFGNDLSYVNEMEDCGAVFRENDQVQDPFALMAVKGTNLCRVRLWHDPYFLESVPKVSSEVKSQYSNLEDVTKTIRRAKEAGMEVMLGIHYSDFWADPGRQVIPRAWIEHAADDEKLSELVYEYTKEVLEGLDALGLMPEIVKLGNESNGGILLQDELHSTDNGDGTFEYEGSGTWRDSDERLSKLWNAGIRATREVGANSVIDPKIALHVADPKDFISFYDRMVRIGVSDFDIAGFSYYYAWHGGTIEKTGDVIRTFKHKYPNYEAMIVETGYLWDDKNIDGLVNIISKPDPLYLPVGQKTQYRYMVDLTQEVIDAGGSGVIFWEPLWVSTPCRTPWGRGSSHEHVAYFDHRNNDNLHIGGTWMEADYNGLTENIQSDVSLGIDEDSGQLSLLLDKSIGTDYTVLSSEDLKEWELTRSFRAREDGEVSVPLGVLSNGSLFAKAREVAR